MTLFGGCWWCCWLFHRGWMMGWWRWYQGWSCGFAGDPWYITHLGWIFPKKTHEIWISLLLCWHYYWRLSPQHTILHWDSLLSVDSHIVHKLFQSTTLLLSLKQSSTVKQSSWTMDLFHFLISQCDFKAAQNCRFFCIIL